MNKYLPLFLFLLSFVQISNAQFLWYENETNTNYIEFLNTTSGTYFTDVANPDVTGINTNTIVSKFNKDEGLESFLSYDIFNPVTDFSGYSITIKAYIDIPTEELTSSNSKLRMFFESSLVSHVVFKELNFTVGQEWQFFTFDFDGTGIPEEVLNTNGYDRIEIGFTAGSIVEPEMDYYIDSIYGTIDQVVNADNHVAGWLSGSWGVTFPVFGGERLDSEVAKGMDHRSGAQEVVDNLPAAGHIITNLSYFAHSHYFTLRQNANVDVVNEIHESLAPSVQNEQIIFDVMQKFKDSGKKIILYISTNYLDRADNETHEAWVNYYTNNFGGDEYLAYRDLIEGYVKIIKNYADGYWLDTTAELNGDGHIEDFVQMIRDIDPDAAITAQPSGVYFQENGENILVDSDGVDDVDERDYRIINFEGANSYQDYTSGHVTPLGQGAPPNSWAYEEFTLPAMVANPWSKYGSKIILRHGWFPVRDKWHVPTANLIFGTEDAYRFTRTIRDAKAGITFATTVSGSSPNRGYMMAEEMVIMKEINDRLLSSPMPDYEPYVRPEGAFLVGEESLSTNSFNNTSQVKFYPNPVIDKLTIARLSTDVNYITVVTILGTKVITKVWDNGSTNTELDLSKLNLGLYFVRLSNGNNHSITRRIIVSK